ncbi:hypothetical protein [Streptomyces dysideae]|uniref:Uncharacterized protein n=1 Tax=Streptomyces dysideae TaxID=909626 RepID=A0A101UZC8_9ACTN|nr:hypothetical protein [Streptomyces dysideae]KUO19665.1 hypothetical protein AQJ91_17720 [Streptomyces dysideae]
MKIDHAAIESTLPTEVDELIDELDYLQAPAHITTGNRLLRAELGDVDDADLHDAVYFRKRMLCGACKTGSGRHSEPDGARVQEFTPGVRTGR